MLQGLRNRIAGRSLVRSAQALFAPRTVARRLLSASGVLLLGALAFLVGRSFGPGTTIAGPTAPPRTSAYSEDSAIVGRVVAYINDNEPISREELAEYLIARFGASRLEFFVNRIIIERACKARNIAVTDSMVEDQFRQDLKSLGGGISADIFQKEILSRYQKTIFEWKEDVIRPKIMLQALCRPMIHLTDTDLMEGFEAKYGPKVQCRMILLKDKNEGSRIWQEIKSSVNIQRAFLEYAEKQADTRLGSVKGEVPPIHKNFGDKRVEREAFSLQPGEMSSVIEMPDQKAILLLCEKHIPAETLRSFQAERLALDSEMREIRLGQKMNEYLAELRRAARPRYLLTGRESYDQLKQNAEDTLGYKSYNQPRPN